MKVNTAKQMMRDGRPAFGYVLGLGSPQVAEILGRSGIDFLILDRQHGSWGEANTSAALVAITGGAAVPMARVATNNYTAIGRLLDEGVLGIIAPLVHTAEDARQVADACRFPPTGQRSWGWGRALAYGRDYPDWIDEQIFVSVQIESAQAVNNAEAIMAVPGIDGCWVGPSDLALSLGISPHEMYEREEHARALEQIVRACRATGKIAGIAGGSLEEAAQRVAQGYQFITAGSDLGFLLSGSDETTRALQAVQDTA